MIAIVQLDKCIIIVLKLTLVVEIQALLSCRRPAAFNRNDFQLDQICTHRPCTQRVAHRTSELSQQVGVCMDLLAMHSQKLVRNYSLTLAPQCNARILLVISRSRSKLLTANSTILSGAPLPTERQKCSNCMYGYKE